MHPALILLIGVFSEVLVQFVKRAVYWIDSSASILYYATLLIGDLVFFGLYALMFSRLRFQRCQFILITLFTLILGYTIFVSGLAAAILAVRNTYLWILFTLLFAMSIKKPVGYGAVRPLIGVTQFISLFLIMYAIVQVQSDYAFEKPWFEFSGTSLNYDGVTNFGQAAKAFSLFGGPTDFAVFGLFALSIGIAACARSLIFFGGVIMVMSGTRGILVAIPVWLLISFLPAKNLTIKYLISVTLFFTVIILFSDNLIAFLYAIPNARFSFATLAPRIELWMGLDFMSLIYGGGFAINLANDIFTNAPNVIDSGIIYFLSEVGAAPTLGIIYLLLTAAQADLIGSRRGALQLLIGVLLVASIAQIPLYTRLSNFLICLLIYASHYHVKSVQIRGFQREKIFKSARSNSCVLHVN